MIILFPSLITLASVFILRGLHPFRYVLIFLLALFATYCSQGNTCEHNPKNAYPGILSEEAVKDHFDAAVRYSQHGFRYLNAAQEMCIFLPEIEEGRVTKDLMKALVTSIGGTDCKAKLVLSFLTIIASYAEHVFDEWEDYEHLMYQSKYYFELSEFHQDIVFYNRLENRG